MSIQQAIASAIVASKGEADVNCIWVGLSAGVDSTVLLHALVKEVAESNFPLGKAKIKAIHVHHGLSNNADDWAQHAQSICEQLSQNFAVNIECIVEQVKLDDYSDGLEQAARKARYDIFEKYCREGDVLLQGHHLDDQIETFFMRALRGSGLTGLSGIPQQRNLSRENHCQILRPLLSIEKSHLVQYAEQHHLIWVEDESNSDSTIERNWWRNELLPKIWQRYPNKKPALSRTINNVQQEQGLLHQFIADALDSQKKCSQGHARINPALDAVPSFDLSIIENFESPKALRYIRAWLAQYVDILPSAIQMQSIYVDMIQAKQDADPSVIWSNQSLCRYKGHLYLWGNNELSIAQPSSWQGESLSFIFGQLSCHTQEESMGLLVGDYALRYWQVGDIAKPAGRSTRKMKKWWQDYNVPSWARNHWPLIVDKETDNIVAVPGLFVCQGYCVEKHGWELNWLFKNHSNSV